MAVVLFEVIPQLPNRVKIVETVDGTPKDPIYFGVNSTDIAVRNVGGFGYVFLSCAGRTLKMPRAAITPAVATNTAAEAYFASILHA